MSRHRLEIEVEVKDDVIEENRNTGSFRGPPDAWINVGDIDWARRIGAIDDDAPIIDYTEVKDGS